MFPFGDFNLPGAAGNWQEIMTRWWSPNITLNFAGNAAIEREVNEDVASYGRQIGWLNDIVTALAAASPGAVEANPAAAGSLAKLKDAQVKIDAIKERRRTNALHSAREALCQLGKTNMDAYSSLVRSLDPERPPGAE